MSTIEIKDKLLSKNDQNALANRNLFDRHGVWCVNLISAPGSGKTSLIESTADHLSGRLNLGVLVGDLETENDANRIAAHGVPVRQIITGGACHLNARTVGDFLVHFDLERLDALIIENVGNLVCPASYYLGEHDRVSLISTPEGDDKPLKYPAMFRNASVLLINKIDLVPYVNCSVDTMVRNAMTVNPKLKIFKMSCTTNEGIPEWCGWLEEQLKK